MPLTPVVEGQSEGFPRKGGDEKFSRDGFMHRRKAVLSALQDKEEPAHNHIVLRGG